MEKLSLYSPSQNDNWIHCIDYKNLGGGGGGGQANRCQPQGNLSGIVCLHGVTGVGMTGVISIPCLLVKGCMGCLNFSFLNCGPARKGHSLERTQIVGSTMNAFDATSQQRRPL